MNHKDHKEHKGILFVTVVPFVIHMSLVVP